MFQEMMPMTQGGGIQGDFYVENFICTSGTPKTFELEFNPKYMFLVTNTGNLERLLYDFNIGKGYQCRQSDSTYYYNSAWDAAHVSKSGNTVTLNSYWSGNTNIMFCGDPT